MCVTYFYDPTASNPKRFNVYKAETNLLAADPGTSDVAMMLVKDPHEIFSDVQSYRCSPQKMTAITPIGDEGACSMWSMTDRNLQHQQAVEETSGQCLHAPAKVSVFTAINDGSKQSLATSVPVQSIHSNTSPETVATCVEEPDQAPYSSVKGKGWDGSRESIQTITGVDQNEDAAPGQSELEASSAQSPLSA
ncbi:hypothetical protein I316_03540 [Kwoniella heveanensis BCC8398]|uniref:Uncharacterized protein n=1 Tax=Kwoniella heveanensis BCC8398 TaxID=1296120 RepID=A0A1B9GVE0_9TREE|nr:hypothetical protein I316_03540 [Kwoniella heveanensis BCC8398]